MGGTASAASQIDTMVASTVSIETINSVTTDFLGDSNWAKWRGSGILVSTEPCEVWTNYHIVRDAIVIEVTPAANTSGAKIIASLHNADPRSDIAILRLEHCSGLHAARVGNSDEVKQGDTVFAIGNPTGRNPGSISRGIISHIHRMPTGILHFLQTDTAVSAGSSGGGLFDTEGEVIAMISAVVVDAEQQPTGFAYAVPINLLRQIVRQLGDSPPHYQHIGLEGKIADLGASEAEAMGFSLNRSAVIITQSPAYPPAIGLLEKRDIIYAVDGDSVMNSSDFRWLLTQKQPGEEVSLSVLRSGEMISVRIPVSSTPIELTPTEPESYEGHLGLVLDDWSKNEDERGFFKTPIITRVLNLGPAHYAGVSSIQHYLVRFLDESMPVLMEVRTISGVIEDKAYRPVSSIEQIDGIASIAASEDRTLVFEIQTWQRSSMRHPQSAFVHKTTSYHTLKPRAFEGSQ